MVIKQIKQYYPDTNNIFFFNSCEIHVYKTEKPSEKELNLVEIFFSATAVNSWKQAHLNTLTLYNSPKEFKYSSFSY